MLMTVYYFFYVQKVLVTSKTIWSRSKILTTVAHCAFSSNLFHGQIAQIAIHQLRDKENVALEKFFQQTTLKPCDFWAGEALEAWTQNCLNITSAQKWHFNIFQISAKKNFRAW